MGISLTRAVLSEANDRAALTTFLTSNTFPFHVRTNPTKKRVEEAIDAGSWGGDDIETFWVDDESDGRVGVLRLDDLRDATAMIDLRLAEHARGRGHGAVALRMATDRVFSHHPVVIRFEGQTREDNVAMRRVFERCGWVLEAHYRDGWPVEGGEPVASVAYSVLRRDWESGSTTPVRCGSASPRRGETRRADGGEAERVPAYAAEHLAPTRAETLAAAAWAAEERLLDPAVRTMPVEVARLLDPDFVEFGQTGHRWTREAIIAALREQPGTDPSPLLEERTSRLVGPDTVLLTYLLRFEHRVSRRSSLWRCDPAPRCLFHQGTPVV